MAEERLNNYTMVVRIHSTDTAHSQFKIQLKVASDFTSLNDQRRSLFGKY